MKILFLDIDGVMKPGRSYWLPSSDRDGGFDPLAVACVNRICERTNAKIVFNTVWNLQGINSLKSISRKQGIKASILGMTKFPETDNRKEAIMQWLQHRDVEAWCALDDAIIFLKNAIEINYLNGISVENYRQATRLLGNEDKFMVLL